MNGDNQEREINGLISALRFFNLREGVIITISQTDKVLVDGYSIQVIPIYEFDFIPVNRNTGHFYGNIVAGSAFDRTHFCCISFSSSFATSFRT